MLIFRVGIFLHVLSGTGRRKGLFRTKNARDPPWLSKPDEGCRGTMSPEKVIRALAFADTYR
jgi:hypothetical protein